jgi:hypothetical protein
MAIILIITKLELDILSIILILEVHVVTIITLKIQIFSTLFSFFY